MKSQTLKWVIGAVLLSSTAISPAEANAHRLEQRIKKLEAEIQALKKEEAEEKTQATDNDFSAKLGGRVKLDTLFDTGPRGGNYGLDVVSIPLKRFNPAAEKQGHFNFSLVASQINAEAKKTIAGHMARGYIELDFNKDGSVSTNSYGPRIRYAYAECGGWLIGQTDFHFQDYDAYADTIDNYYGASRQAMIRYRHTFNPHVYLSAALERPNTDYIDQNGNYLDNSSGQGKSPLPDFSARLNFSGKMGYISLRGLVRQEQIKTRVGDLDSAGNAFTTATNRAKTGWGAGISARLYTWGKSAIFGQINGGQGVGRYLENLDGHSIYFQAPTTAAPNLSTRFDMLKAVNYTLAYEHHWCEKTRSSLSINYTRIYTPTQQMISVPTFNRELFKYFANFIYTINPHSELGVELMHMRRMAGSTQRFKGYNTRILTGYRHKF